MAARVLLTGGFVLSMDAEIGELAGGEVLIEDGRIAAVGSDLGVEDAEILDAAGTSSCPASSTPTATPGRPASAASAPTGPSRLLPRHPRAISPNCSAEDVYAGNLVGALEALDAGVTTILDFSHCNNTPEHADAALAGLRDAGIRALFAYGYFPAPTADRVRRPRGAARRRATAARARAASDDALVTMGVALTESGLLPFEPTLAEARSARELEVPVVSTRAAPGARR